MKRTTDTNDEMSKEKVQTNLQLMSRRRIETNFDSLMGTAIFVTCYRWIVAQYDSGDTEEMGY